MSAEKKLQVKDLTISFRTVNGKLQAVRDISFDLYKGETLAIVGESGSGKSATSKTILGISAANTIVEGGEILYDGKDLLKITEEDFHSIRGDKIAMVFQDPLSSLNPIMRVGKQLTEAQLLKNKARRRECKKKLNEGMKALNDAMIASGCNVDKSLFETFRAVIKEQSKHEGPYDTAHTNAVAALKAADDMLLAIDKNALTDAKGDAKELKSYALGAVDHFVVRDGEGLKALVNEMMAQAAAGAKSKDFLDLKNTVTKLRAMLQAGADAVTPGFFALGCYIVLDKKTLGDETAEVLNQLTAGSMRGEFMTKFLNHTISALKYTAAESKKNMAVAVEKLAEAEKFFAEMPAADAARKYATELANLVEKAIDPLETVKDSSAYTFRVGLNSAVEAVQKGIEYADITADSMVEVMSGAKQATEMMEKMAVELREEAANMMKIDDNVARVAEIVDNNSATSEETAAVSEEQTAQVATMVQMMEQFVI